MARTVVRGTVHGGEEATSIGEEMMKFHPPDSFGDTIPYCTCRRLGRYVATGGGGMEERGARAARDRVSYARSSLGIDDAVMAPSHGNRSQSGGRNVWPRVGRADSRAWVFCVARRACHTWTCGESCRPHARVVAASESCRLAGLGLGVCVARRAWHTERATAGSGQNSMVPGVVQAGCEEGHGDL